MIMAEMQFESRPQPPHEKPFADQRDSGYQEMPIDISILNDKKAMQKTKQNALDPWSSTQANEDYTKLKFQKEMPPTPAESDDDGIANAEENFRNALKTDNTTLTVDSIIIDPLGDEKAIVNSNTLSPEEKRAKINHIFSLAASNGNVERVSNMLETTREYIDIDSQDDDGTTPLIYAACFGHEAVVYTMLQAGAKVDAQDKNGWTPLMWATNNSRDSTVRLLLDQGADAGAKSAKGHTVFDFMPPENHKIAEIFIHNPQRDSWSSCSSMNRWSMKEDEWLLVGDNENRLVEALAEAEQKQRMLMESSLNLEVDLSSLGLDEIETSDEEMPTEFVWETCLPHQMFVFSSEDIPHIINTVITEMQPIRSKGQKPVPANVLFLSARFAHYYSSSELLEALLYSTIDAIDAVVKSKPEDMTFQAFWIANCTLLLYYFKKDAGLNLTTHEYQIRISEMLHQIYTLLVIDVRRRLERIVEQSILDFETIPLDDVRFEGEWRVFRSLSRRSASPAPGYASAAMAKLKRNSTPALPSSRAAPQSPRQRSAPSPRNVTSLLSSTLFVLQNYDIHPSIIEQVFSQAYYYISNHLFNKILEKKKYICRSKAMQIRLNVSTLEDWVRSNNLPQSTTQHFLPLVQLLQLLQCWSSMSDFTTLISTTKDLNMINPAQLKCVLKNYRYEVKEPHITEEGQLYILQLEEDTERRRRSSHESIRSMRSDSSGMVFLPNIINNGVPNGSNANGWEDEEELVEARDTMALLQFNIPTSAEMLANFGGKEKDLEFIPVIPDEYCSRLDKAMNHGTSSIIYEDFDDDDDDDDEAEEEENDEEGNPKTQEQHEVSLEQISQTE